ncbi:MAG: hypothetical protein ABI681_02210, partial [Gemmatimonadales bacterium]
GPVYPKKDMSWIQWSLRMTGHIPYFEGKDGKSTFDTSKLIQISDSAAASGIQRSDLLFDLAGLPTAGFQSAGGPWLRPK